MHHASSAGKEAAVRWLVEFGADDQTKDNEGNTAMHHAVTNNHLKSAIWLQHFSNCDVRQINNRLERFLVFFSWFFGKFGGKM